MLFLLGLSGLIAFVVLHDASPEAVVHFGGVSSYPVARLAKAGDTQATDFLGKKLSSVNCASPERQRGARYLTHAARAGHSGAQFVLGQFKIAEDDTQAGLALIRQSAAVGHASARADLTVRAAPRDGGHTACLDLIAMHCPFVEDAEHLSRACD